MRYTPFEAMNRPFEQMRGGMGGPGSDGSRLWADGWSDDVFGRNDALGRGRGLDMT